jgi:hypothetical protein
MAIYQQKQKVHVPITICDEEDFLVQDVSFIVPSEQESVTM